MEWFRRGCSARTIGKHKCLMYGCSAVFWKRRWATVFAGLILACLARCGFCGGGPFATSTVLLHLSGYDSSGILRFMRRWQILATWLLFLRAVHYWPTKDMCLQPSFVFPSSYIFTPRKLSFFLYFFYFAFLLCFPLFVPPPLLSCVCTLPYRPWGLPAMGPRSFPRVKRPERGVNHPHYLAQRLKKEHSHTSVFSHVLHGRWWDKLLLYFYYALFSPATYLVIKGRFFPVR